MADSSSGRDSGNSGSDSAKYFKGTAHEQFGSTPKAGPATPTTAPNGNTVRDLAPTPVAGSTVK